MNFNFWLDVYFKQANTQAVKIYIIHRNSNGNITDGKWLEVRHNGKTFFITIASENKLVIIITITFIIIIISILTKNFATGFFLVTFKMEMVPRLKEMRTSLNNQIKLLEVLYHQCIL